MYNVLWGNLPGGDGVVVRAETSEGVRMYVSQEYDNPSEPYYVSFYSSLPGKNWRSYYIDHQAIRWHNCEIKINEEERIAEIYREDFHEATFYWEKGKLEWVGSKAWGNTGNNMPPGWKSEWEGAAATR